MELEIHAFVPQNLIDSNMLEQDFEYMLQLYAKSNYFKKLHIQCTAQAIAKAFGE